MSKTHKQKPTISSGLLFIAFADFSISEKSGFFKLSKTAFYCLLLSYFLTSLVPHFWQKQVVKLLSTEKEYPQLGHFTNTSFVATNSAEGLE